MTPTEEAQFIQLWQEGASYQAIAQAMRCPLGTVASRSAALAAQGKITPRQRGGAKARQEGSPADRPPSTVHRPRSTVHPVPSTVDPRPSTVDHLREDLQAALTAALQPVLARLEALEAGLARPPHDNHPPSTVHPGTVDGPPSHRPPSTVDPDTWELRQLKHSVRWTVYVPQAMKEELQRRAAATGQTPSLLVQEALARWLAEEAP
jgi:DNA-binding transcriptional MocR family regulator